MPRERDIPQPQESWKQRNKRTIEGLSRFGGNLEKAVWLVNGLVQEVAREQEFKDDLPFSTAIRQDDVLGGKFSEYITNNGVAAEAFVEVFKYIDTDNLRRNKEIKVEVDTRFVTNAGCILYMLNPAERTHGSIARNTRIQTWDLEEIENNPKVMERFIRDTKVDLRQALEETRNAENVLAEKSRRYERIQSLIEDFNNPDAFRNIH